MNRWKAALIHLTIGLLILGTIVGAMFHFWYPHALYRIAGIDQLLFTMLFVDLVAGPLLTCIVYKVNDHRTKWDLSIICALQAVFLGYALHTAWITRPVFLVWSVDHFSLLFANEIKPEALEASKIDRLPWSGPRLYAITLPQDLKTREAIFLSLVNKQTSIELMPEHYGPYSAMKQKVLRQAAHIEDAAGTPSSRDPRIATAIAASGRRETALRLVAIESTRDNSALLIDASTGEPLEVLPLGALGTP